MRPISTAGEPPNEDQWPGTPCSRAEMCELSELSELSPGSELDLRWRFDRPENLRDMRDKRDKGVSEHACYPY